MPLGTTAFAANPTWAVVEPPPTLLDKPIYFYECSDATCLEQHQLADNGYVTQVPKWKATNPATWVFLKTDGVSKFYKLWKGSETNWMACILHLEATGQVGAFNTCIGATKISESSSSEVSKIALGAAPFPPSTTAPIAPQSYNPLKVRSITFSNTSTATGVCVQTDNSYAQTMCEGEYVYDIIQAPYVRAIPQNGDNSRAAEVMGIKYTVGGPWIPTGREIRTGQTYATKLEWNVFPTENTNQNSDVPSGTTDHSIGPTTIDVSLVDGFNVGVELVPDQDTVCAIAEYENGPLIFKLYRADAPMAVFPTDLAVLEDDICPKDFLIKAGPSVGIIQTGCFSQCSWANATGQGQEVIHKNCCQGAYDTFKTCDGVIDRQYIDNVAANSDRVYTWAYNDNIGTFTCDGAASFTFRITDVFDPRR